MREHGEDVSIVGHSEDFSPTILSLLSFLDHFRRCSLDHAEHLDYSGVLVFFEESPVGLSLWYLNFLRESGEIMQMALN
jgi:hypothetical protein